MYCGCILKFQRPAIDLILRSMLCKLECVFEWMSTIARQYICPWTKFHMRAKSFFCLPLDHWSMTTEAKMAVTPGKINRTPKNVSVVNTVIYTIPFTSPSPYEMWYWPVRCKPKGLSELSQMRGFSDEEGQACRKVLLALFFITFLQLCSSFLTCCHEACWFRSYWEIGRPQWWKEVSYCGQGIEKKVCEPSVTSLNSQWTQVLPSLKLIVLWGKKRNCLSCS